MQGRQFLFFFFFSFLPVNQKLARKPVKLEAKVPHSNMQKQGLPLVKSLAPKNAACHSVSANSSEIGMVQ